jgi:hypothetical protein
MTRPVATHRCAPGFYITTSVSAPKFPEAESNASIDINSVSVDFLCAEVNVIVP